MAQRLRGLDLLHLPMQGAFAHQFWLDLLLWRLQSRALFRQISFTRWDGAFRALRRDGIKFAFTQLMVILFRQVGEGTLVGGQSRDRLLARFIESAQICPTALLDLQQALV